MQIPRIRKPNPRIYGSDEDSMVTQKSRKHTKTTIGVSITLTRLWLCVSQHSMTVHCVSEKKVVLNSDNSFAKS